ncbi:MAG: DUF2934 domain-containing protein [Nitrospirales bacterium]
MAKRRSTTEETGNEPADVRKNAKAPAASKSETQFESQTATVTSEPGLSLVEYNARVARKAYDLFERHGRNEGHDVEDWLEAERLVKEELLQHGEAVIS